MVRAGTAYVDIRPDWSSLNKGIDKEARSAKAKFAKIGKAAAAGVAVGIGGLGLLGKAAVDSAVDISESLSKNQVLFGKQAKAVKAFAATTSQSLGISRAAALEATGTFGNLFVALDIAPKKSAKMSIGLTKLASDLASFNNASPEEALEAIRSGLVGETEPLRKFGVNLSDAALRTEALRQGLVKTTKDALTPQQKALAVNALLFKQTEKAQGDFARTSGGLANQQRIVKARLADLSATIGARVMPIVLAATKVVNKWLAQWADGEGPLARAQAVLERIGRSIGTVTGAIKSLIGRFKEGDTAAVALVAVLGALAAGFAAFRIIATVIAGMKALKLAVIGVNLAMTANPVGLVVAALVGLGVALVVAYKKSEKFRDIVNGVFTAVRKVVLGAFDAYLGGVTSFLRGLQAMAEGASHLPLVGDQFKGVAEGIDFAADKIDLLREKIREVGKEKVKPIEFRVKFTYKGKSFDLGPEDSLTQLPQGDGAGRTVSIAMPSITSGLMGANPALGPIAAVGASHGTRVTSGKRAAGGRTSTGGISYHGSGEAVDMAGSPKGMLATFRALKQRFGSRLAELIYTPGGIGIKNGRAHRYSGKVAADHFDHVHAALDLGAPGPGIGSFGGNRGDGYGKSELMNLWVKAGGSSATANLAAAVALAESRGNPKASNRNRDGSTDRGLWQINSIHKDLSTFAALGNAKAAVKLSNRGKNWKPWVAFNTGAYKKFLKGGKLKATRALEKTGLVSAGGRVPGITGRVSGDEFLAPSDFSDGFVEPEAAAVPPTVLEALNTRFSKELSEIGASKALAGLTETLADDFAEAMKEREVFRVALEEAKAAGDTEAITQFATAFKASIDATAALAEEMTHANAIAEEERQRRELLISLQEETAANQRKLMALASSQPNIIAAGLIELISGGVGAKVGLGVQTPGFAGGRVRY